MIHRSVKPVRVERQTWVWNCYFDEAIFYNIYFPIDSKTHDVKYEHMSEKDAVIF